ncbi:MAG TPA: FecR domain-containing protein [Candidatus Deferrimicrobiaceae bacterium]
MTSRKRNGTILKVLFAIFLLVLPAAAWCLTAGEQDTIGVVRNSTGTATVTRGDQPLQAVPGTRLQAGDTLSTGFDGSMGVIFRDNSTLSLGPGSTLAIRSFLYSPREGKLGLLARISSGTMAYISGLIGKLAPQSVRFDTPVATIGIRGTYFAVIVGEPDSR